ncbi:hypothetical protein P171DRAFT_487995 [Karstenula rhodostoma CBS 690.94]|uniref:Uncharacterized protein n=1 Tax=Karstenula rhodostoma CBS 690.94 TaxID=1392251 RepID=A0A9P4PCW0_9PLEO|nr:hypothetical protein P171DRAFT_487995 [Karstenula rhodostoma CBS 690.94]
MPAGLVLRQVRATHSPMGGAADCYSKVGDATEEDLTTKEHDSPLLDIVVKEIKDLIDTSQLIIDKRVMRRHRDEGVLLYYGLVQDEFGTVVTTKEVSSQHLAKLQGKVWHELPLMVAMTAKGVDGEATNPGHVYGVEINYVAVQSSRCGQDARCEGDAAQSEEPEDPCEPGMKTGIEDLYSGKEDKGPDRYQWQDAIPDDLGVAVEKETTDDDNQAVQVPRDGSGIKVWEVPLECVLL